MNTVKYWSIIVTLLILSVLSVLLCVKCFGNKPVSYVCPLLLVLFIYYKLEINYLLERIYNRIHYYNLAESRAKLLNRPLVVIGNPYSGPTNKLIGKLYDCGDYTIDINGSPKCPVDIKGDIVESLQKFDTDSAVIYISYVLEYVENIESAISEIYRVAGSANNIFIIHAQNGSKISKTKWSSGRCDPYSKYVITSAPPTSSNITYSKINNYARIDI